MSWIPKPLTELPLILSGPLLRKVTPNEVNVFIAIQQNISVKLQIFSTGGSLIGETAYIPPVKLGDNLFVINIRKGSLNLNPNTCYSYNLSFQNIGDLSSNNVLVYGTGSTSSIVYDNSPSVNGVKLPSFVIPPPEINDLWILHGSCRKPHGEGFDAMDGICDAIEAAVNVTQPTVSTVRPQILCLTGDQIYSDDVADSLLHMINMQLYKLFPTTYSEIDISIYDNLKMNLASNSTTNIDLNRDIENKFGAKNLPNNYDFNNLSRLTFTTPGLRRTFIQETCKFVSYNDEDNGVSDPCKSHLITFNEFVTMYLFVWSDVLWQGVTEIPDWNDVNYLQITNTIEYCFSEINNIEYKATSHDIKGSTKEYVTTDPYPTSKKEQFDLENTRLLRFKSSLPKVRKALANISTYMILDDHEITDDLFFNRAWCNEIESSTYGKKLIVNGLAAYTLFQQWGNTPEKFVQTNTPESNFINNITNYPVQPNPLNNIVSSSNSNPLVKSSSYQFMIDCLYPTLDPSSSVPGTSLNNFPEYKINPTNQIEFNFRLEHSSWNYELIFLDTRRERASFYKDTGGISTLDSKPSIISYNALRRQIDNVTLTENEKKDLTIIVNATPFLENRAVMFGVDLANEVAKTELKVDSEGWLDIKKPILFFDIIHQILERGKLTVGGIFEHRAVILGGDVHYAFTKSLEFIAYDNFLDHTTFPYGSKLKLISLCASSFKNQTNDVIAGTIVAHGDILLKNISPLPFKDEIRFEEEYFFGWKTINENKATYEIIKNNLTDKLTWEADTIPVYKDITDKYNNQVFYSSLITTPSKSFEGKIQIYNSTKHFLITPVLNSLVGLVKKKYILDKYKDHYLTHDKKKGRIRVGKNNFGEILFDWNNSTKSIYHNLWWRDNLWNEVSSLSQISSLTRHNPIIDFEL